MGFSKEEKLFLLQNKEYDALLLGGDISEDNRNKVMMHFHKQCPVLVGKEMVDFSLIDRKTIPAHYTPINPSIIPDTEMEEGYIMNVRYVNYHCTEQNQYICNLPDETIVQTENLYVWLNRDFRPYKSCLVNVNLPFIKYDSPVQGIEDVRLFSLRDRNDPIIALCNSREISPDTMPTQCFAECVPEKGEFSIECDFYKQTNKGVVEPQKNWLPFIHPKNKEYCFIYTTGPYFMIVKINPVTHTLDVSQVKETGLYFHQVRGGSSPVEFSHSYLPECRYIYAVHFAWDRPNIRRMYFHRFVYLDANLLPIGISAAFKLFNDECIEFVISAISMQNGDIVLGVGKNDTSAHLLRLKNETICDIKYYGIK